MTISNLTKLNIKNTTTYGFRNQGPCLDRHTHVAGLNWLKESSPSPLITGSSTKIQINKQTTTKPADLLQLTK